MKKNDFYLCLNVLNIILGIYIVAMMFVLWITLGIAPNDITPTCLFALLIIIKLLFLTVLFNIVKKKFPNILLNKVLKELKINLSSRKCALLLSFGYDVVIILFFSLLQLKETDFVGLLFLPIFWEIFTLGGVCMFYIALFGIWKIQDRLKNI